MSKKLDHFYDFLMRHYRGGTVFTLDEACAATGYEASSLKTNISKHLKDRWIDVLDGPRYGVRNFGAVSPAVFAGAMSQNTRLTFSDESEWREHLRRLLALGVQNGYSVTGAVRDILSDLRLDVR